MLIYINQTNNCKHLIIIMKQKKALIPDDTSIKKVCKVKCKKKNFYGEAKLIKINDIYNKDNSKDYVFIKKLKKVLKKLLNKKRP